MTDITSRPWFHAAAATVTGWLVMLGADAIGLLNDNVFREYNSHNMAGGIIRHFLFGVQDFYMTLPPFLIAGSAWFVVQRHLLPTNSVLCYSATAIAAATADFALFSAHLTRWSYFWQSQLPAYAIGTAAAAGLLLLFASRKTNSATSTPEHTATT